MTADNTFLRRSVQMQTSHFAPHRIYLLRRNTPTAHLLRGTQDLHWYLDKEWQQWPFWGFQTRWILCQPVLVFIRASPVWFFCFFLVHSALVFCSLLRIWFLFFSTRTIPVFYRSQKHCNFLTPITLWHQGKARQPRNFAAHTLKARAVPHTYLFPLEIPENAALSCAVLCPSCLDSTAPRAHHVISHLWSRLGILWAAKKVCNFPLGCFFKLTCICLRLRTVKPYKRFKFCSFWTSQTPKVLKRHCGWVTSWRR